MSKQSIDASVHIEGARQSEQLFPVEREYARCITALNRTGILTLLPKSESMGVIGIDGKEYPIPTQERIVELFAHNRELVGRKVPQGFDRLELTPMAMPTSLLIDRMKAAILKHAAEGKIYQTRRSPSRWWHRDVGRARLDMHRTGNKLCTRSWGGSSTVRLLKP